MLQPVVEGHEFRLGHSGGGEDLRIVDDPVEEPVILQLPSYSGIALVRVKDVDVILFVHPYRFESADVVVISGDFSPCAMFGGRHGKGFTARFLIEQEFRNHLRDISRPAHGRLNIFCLFRKNRLSAGESSADSICGFQSHQLITHKRISDGGTDDRPVVPGKGTDHIFTACFVNGVIV